MRCWISAVIHYRCLCAFIRVDGMIPSSNCWTVIHPRECFVTCMDRKALFVIGFRIHNRYSGQEYDWTVQVGPSLCPLLVVASRGVNRGKHSRPIEA